MKPANFSMLVRSNIICNIIVNAWCVIVSRDVFGRLNSIKCWVFCDNPCLISIQCQWTRYSH
uniref:Uncharacterized protein n=1 Tax=Rhizophora mucronata TaxID=61149 RepID=A0A2P2PII3_RHIMU